ncbi:YdeI/OmpD-associated family protein [Gorillibacterium massiliense]|uniref:YdeI/OmpD-associated family protein n=1 Tax=Gorillibacterium massiliense TaxID=1280390 RepID=UPI0004B33E78|nr:YdeI/OmpD-associated family protein [Gorillibacterium massiliense]
MPKKTEKWPILFFPDQQAFAEWLNEHHDTVPGIRLQIAKKGADFASVSYAEALDVALCYGWIDSQKEAVDEKTWIQRFGPRGAKSIWSQVNKEKVERLIAEGRMQPPGLQAIEAAKKNGQWDKAYAPQSALKGSGDGVLPEDFAAALALSPQGKAFFETLNKQNKFAILFRIQNAKKPETRNKKIQQYIEMLEKGEKLYP